MKLKLFTLLLLLALGGCATKPRYIPPEGVELSNINLVAPEWVPRALNFDIFPDGVCSKENGKFAAFFFRSSAPREVNIKVESGKPVAFDILNFFGGGEIVNSGNSCRDRVKFVPKVGVNYRLEHVFDNNLKSCSAILEEISDDGNKRKVDYVDPGADCMLITK